MSEKKPVDGLDFHIHHTMLPVASLDRSVDFYTRLLGMTLKQRHASEARKVEVGLVGYGETAVEPFLELIRDCSENAPAQVTPLNAHIAIDVSDLRRLCDVLERERVPLVRPFRERSDGKGFGAWIADPDGNQIELAERHPDR